MSTVRAEGPPAATSAAIRLWAWTTVEWSRPKPRPISGRLVSVADARVDVLREQPQRVVVHLDLVVKEALAQDRLARFGPWGLDRDHEAALEPLAQACLEPGEL